MLAWASTPADSCVSGPFPVRLHNAAGWRLYRRLPRRCYERAPGRRANFSRLSYRTLGGRAATLPAARPTRPDCAGGRRDTRLSVELRSYVTSQRQLRHFCKQLGRAHIQKRHTIIQLISNPEALKELTMSSQAVKTLGRGANASMALSQLQVRILTTELHMPHSAGAALSDR